MRMLPERMYPCGPSENEADYQPVLSIGANESKQHCQCNGQA